MQQPPSSLKNCGGLAFYTYLGIEGCDDGAPAPFLGRFFKARLQRFPKSVQKDMGVALFVVQLGGVPSAAKPWKGLGAGVHELVEDHRGDTYRAVYTVRIADAVHVLHAFQKKSKSGVKTPRMDVKLIEQRL